MAGLPHYAKGEVVKGFGRGAKDLGYPTANFSEQVVNELPDTIKTGVYYGFASVDKGEVHKMVMSIGWNPFYKNVKKTMETYIIHKFLQDFYGKELRVAILGYLRPEADFSSLEELIKQIRDDVENAVKELDKPEFVKYKSNNFFKN